jgi:hypothetical protein
MKTQKINWKRWLLIPFLCILLVLAGGCGKSGAADKGQDEEQQELQQLEAASDTPGSDVFDDQQEADAQENADNYDPESDYGGEESEGYKQEGDSYDQDSDNDSSEQKDQSSGSGEIEENGVYTTMEDVALYIHTYGKLPLNFMTKKEAKALGWSGGSLEDYAPGMCIGGDRFGNYEGVLPDGNYHECDINTLRAARRGAERLVYSDDGRIYYTNDHYETFTLLYGSSD